MKDIWYQPLDSMYQWTCACAFLDTWTHLKTCTLDIQTHVKEKNIYFCSFKKWINLPISRLLKNQLTRFFTCGPCGGSFSVVFYVHYSIPPFSSVHPSDILMQLFSPLSYWYRNYTPPVPISFLEVNFCHTIGNLPTPHWLSINYREAKLDTLFCFLN